MRRILVTIAALAFFTSTAIVASVATEVKQDSAPAVAAWHWENWLGPISFQGLTLSQGYCYGPHPYWFDKPWGWTSYPNHCYMLLKYCEYDPWNGYYVQKAFKYNAWFNEHYNGTKWADQMAGTGLQHFGIVDARPDAQAYCSWRVNVMQRWPFNWPEYF